MEGFKIFKNIFNHGKAEYVYNCAYAANYKIGWNDSVDLHAKQYPCLHSPIEEKDAHNLDILPQIQQLGLQSQFEPIFKKMNITKAVINLTKPGDVHFIHSHRDTVVVLYYINLNWKDEFGGETIFYSNDMDIIYTSKYEPRKLIIFDGEIPHCIKPQSILGPQFRFTLSLFLKKT